MKYLNFLLSFLLGADYEILRLCPTEFATQRNRLLGAFIVATLSAISSSMVLKNNYAIYVGIIVFLIYIAVLCKSSGSAFLKFLLAIAIAAFVFWGVSFPIFGGVFDFETQNVGLAAIIGVVDFVICLMPVNLSNGSEAYDKLLKQKNYNIEVNARFLLDERANAEIAIIRNRETARIALDAEINKYISEKKIKSQKIAIDKICEKWVKNMEKEISSNFEKYCSNGKIQQMKINDNDEFELNDYISSLLYEKREEFAKIIIDKWAEEKKQELKNNSKEYICSGEITHYL